ncbi:MAG: MotA/TolQ/ExbB proton channel family protein [Planctomycetota bacterium]
MNKFTTIFLSAAFIALPLTTLTAQEQGGEPEAATAQEPSEIVAPVSPELDAATARMMERLEAARADLQAFRARVDEERLPLATQQREAESRLSEAKASFKEAVDAKDTRGSELGALTQDVEARRAQIKFVTGQLAGFAGEFGSRLLLHEKEEFQGVFDTADQAAANPTLSPAEIFEAQIALVRTSIVRLESSIGGRRYNGRATDAQGFVREGQFVTIGPVAYFAASDGVTVGLVKEVTGTSRPSVGPFANPERNTATAQVLRDGAGVLPLDPTLGSAEKILATEQTWLEHIQAGGPVMYPIFAMAGIALLIALYKWGRLQFVPRPSKRLVRQLLDHVRNGENEEAERTAREMNGPMGEMLLSGTQALGYPKELVEEVMYESMLTSKRRLNSMLPFIAVCAAAAPLMGLLGTVTGIIDTFRLITVYGSGDATSLSGGISEALITTKFGLIVAIPSLLLHAFLSRKARGIVADMESNAIALVNRVSTIESTRPSTATRETAFGDAVSLDSEAVREQVEEIVREMLEPLASTGGGQPQQS